MVQNKFPETIPEEAQILDLLDKNFKTTALSITKELKENKGKELKEFRKKIYEQNKNIQQRDRNCIKKTE